MLFILITSSCIYSAMLFLLLMILLLIVKMNMSLCMRCAIFLQPMIEEKQEIYSNP